MDWFGRAKIRFTHHNTPLPLRSKDGSTTNLLQLIEKSTPTCQLNPLLFNGHLQTCWTSVGKDAPAIYYRRQIFKSNHANYTGTFAVDFSVPAHPDHDEKLPPRTAYFKQGEFEGIASEDSRPMLIVLHGLSGGSYEVYLRHAIAPLVLDKGGWECCVVNGRGCANSEVTSGVLFNARATWDVRQVVRWARKTFPNRPLFGLGFSLGANILTNVSNGCHSPVKLGSVLMVTLWQYVGEEGEGCPLNAAVVVGNPFDLEVANKTLQSSLLGKELYQRVMGSSCRQVRCFFICDLCPANATVV